MMIDPLEIINEFMIWSPSTTGKPCPIDLLEENRAWLTRLCALAERCAQAENRVSELEALVEKGNAAIGENCDLRKRIFETENLLKGCGYEIIWGDEDDERPRLRGHGAVHYPSREDEE